MRNLTPSSLILYIFSFDQTPSTQPITSCRRYVVSQCSDTLPTLVGLWHYLPGCCHYSCEQSRTYPTVAAAQHVTVISDELLTPLRPWHLHWTAASADSCLLFPTLWSPCSPACSPTPKAVFLCKNASSPVFFFQSTKKYGTFSINRLNVFWCKQYFNSSNTFRKVHILIWISHGLPPLYATLKPSVLVSPPSVVQKTWPWNISTGPQIISEEWHSVSHF